MLNCPERQEAIILQEEWEYHRLLDELELRAVSRQFEIEKLGLLKTGTSTCPPSFNPDKDCLAWLHEEQMYISSLQHEPEIEHIRITYLQAIEHLEHAE